MTEQNSPSTFGSSLAQVGLDVIGLFDKIIKNILSGHTAPGLPLDAVANESQRFNLWAVNLGLHQPGHGSLDYRFRDAPEIYQYAQKLLLDLRGALHMSKVTQPSDL
jgi:hypothetical protein